MPINRSLFFGALMDSGRAEDGSQDHSFADKTFGILTKFDLSMEDFTEDPKKNRKEYYDEYVRRDLEARLDNKNIGEKERMELKRIGLGEKWYTIINPSKTDTGDESSVVTPMQRMELALQKEQAFFCTAF